VGSRDCNRELGFLAEKNLFQSVGNAVWCLLAVIVKCERK
jgi:hypothetical protein